MKRILIGAVAAFGWLGCAHFNDQPLSAEKVRADFESRSLADAGLNAFLATNLPAESASPAAWNFNRLTLVAYYFNPDLDVARAQLVGANAAKLTAGARPNPTVGVNAAYNTTTTIPSPWIVTPSLDLPIETMGKRGYRLAQSAHLSEAARCALASAAWHVRSEVRKNLLALYAAGENAALLQQQESAQAESVRLLEGQLRAGTISPYEITQARVALNQTRFALHDAESQSATTRIQLAETLGLPSTALDGVNFDFDEFKQFPADVPDAVARRQALVSRADILGALAEYAATQSALQLEIAKQYPDLHLNPGYEFDQSDNKWGLGLSLELPMLNHNQGPIAEAEARRAESAAKFNALQARVLSEIEQTVAGYRAAAKKAEAAGTLNHELAGQRRAAQALLDVGEISRLELAQRQLELTTAALMQLAALVSAQAALGDLEDAMQSPGAAPAAENTPTKNSSAKINQP
ncbi:MAG: TolC family protein [Verrucomicrobiae bacterium]